jgi:hypothetical protein
MLLDRWFAVLPDWAEEGAMKDRTWRMPAVAGLVEKVWIMVQTAAGQKKVDSALT